MTQNGSSWRRERGGDVLVAALAAGASATAAAKTAGLSRRTVQRRLADPAFRKRVEDANAEIASRAVSKLLAASTRAVDTLTALLTSDMDFARLAAARSILELGAKLRRDDDLVARIEALEAGQPSPSSQPGPTPWRPQAS